MAVTKLFPQKDNYITQLNPNNNYGRDEILEISSGDNISRIIIQFNSDEINNILNNITGSFQSNLKLYLAKAENNVDPYQILIHPLSQSWNMGTGRNKDLPNPQNGSCWNYPDINNINISWSLEEPQNIYKYSQSFQYQDNLDINCEITNIINGWYSGDINNYGFLIKFPQYLETSSLNITNKYFSVDTHTIYPPCLEIYYNDVLYSSSLPILNNSNFITNISNMQNEFTEGEKYKFIIKNRDQYPIRNFQTSSLYLNNKILPENSYWALKDIKTEEIIIDYHELGTKIGADENGNYFYLDFNGLQPERYYQILIKTIINNEVIIIDNKNNYFKLIR
jgi:hypothetical protein